MVGGVVAYYYTQMPPTTTAFSGDVFEKDYAFGFSQNAFAMPGPTLNLRLNESVTVIVHNLGPTGHNWAIVQTKSDTAPVMFSAQAGTPQSPIASGGSVSVTFTPDTAGNYFYICQVPGHLDLGMWGNVVVS